MDGWMRSFDYNVLSNTNSFFAKLLMGFYSVHHSVTAYCMTNSYVIVLNFVPGNSSVHSLNLPNHPLLLCSPSAVSYNAV